MRTIKGSGFPQDNSAEFPFSTIKNETGAEAGTPVVREVYGDVLTNIYKLLQLVGEVPTETEDSDISQYQILDALKKLPNSLNDIERVLTLNTTVWGLPFDTSLLPNKYFAIARAEADYNKSLVYTFEGSNAVSLPFSSTGFKSGDELVVVIDAAGVRAYSISVLSGIDEVFSVMGQPLSYNDSEKMYYAQDGALMSDVPSIDYLENIIRVDVSDGTVLVNDIILTNGYLLCFCIHPNTNGYFFRQFNLSNLSVSLPVSLVGVTFGNSGDYSPYFYAENGFIYLTNGMNDSVNDFLINKLAYSTTGATLTFASATNLDATFVKTTNGVIKSGYLYTLIEGVFNKFSLTTGVKTNVGNFRGNIGNLFNFKGNIYFSSGEVCKLWAL